MKKSFDPLMEEVMRLRDEYRRQFGYDLYKIGKDLMARQGQDGREVVRLSPKRPEQALWRLAS